MKTKVLYLGTASESTDEPFRWTKTLATRQGLNCPAVSIIQQGQNSDHAPMNMSDHLSRLFCRAGCRNLSLSPSAASLPGACDQLIMPQNNFVTNFLFHRKWIGSETPFE
jgi:hypothetical protein